MQASEAISRLAQLIAAHGDRELVIGDEHFTIATVIQDNREELVSAGEVSSSKVFTIYID